MKKTSLFTIALTAVLALLCGCISNNPDNAAKTEVKKTNNTTKASQTAAAPAQKTAAAAKKIDPQKALQKAIKSTTTPVQAKRHAKRHEAKKAFAEANKDKIKILMLGDSITHQWDYKNAAKAKAKYLDPYAILNLGCGGDRTQHTLWIVEKSGILELVKPQLVTLMIGTNNREDYRATAAGIKRILDDVRKLYPEAKILLYAIFPRGKDNNDKNRIRNEKINAEIIKFCDGKNIIWVDIRKNFLTPEGILEKSMMPDLLHPRNVKGYTVWGESLKPYFEKYGK